MKRVLVAGMLLDRQVEDLQGKQINAAWLDALLAPNPTRDVLAWLNDPAATQTKLAGARWAIFTSRCVKDFGFNPESDGVLTAAEKLAEHQGPWANVWELYCESFTSFKSIAGLLAKLQSPLPKGLLIRPTSWRAIPAPMKMAKPRYVMP